VQHVNFGSHLRSADREPLQPARHARTSAQRQDQAGETNVRHVNLDAHQHPVSSKPLRPANRGPVSPPRPRRLGETDVRHGNLDARQRPASSMPLRPANRARASAPQPHPTRRLQRATHRPRRSAKPTPLKEKGALWWTGIRQVERALQPRTAYARRGPLAVTAT
jgi:hypothetical protein